VCWFSALLRQAYGDAGVVKIIKILEREIVHDMQLLGAATVNDLVPEMVGYPRFPMTARD
jgi:isopentenyl diphosphate isomerase/L-lactate dehydrogenase-like FMN-dependent dehydrogenase